MNSGGSNNVSLKYERYASSGCWDKGIIKLGFVSKTLFLLHFLTLSKFQYFELKHENNDEYTHFSTNY